MSKTTIHLLDRLATHLGHASDYRIARELGVSRASVSKWRVGKTGMSDDMAVRVAEVVGEDPAYVLALIHGEATENAAVRRVYWRIAVQFSGKTRRRTA